MKSYTIEFNGSGEVSEGFFSSDSDAVSWVESVLEERGYEPDELVTADWDGTGEDADGQQGFRLLFWANEADADNDAGESSICQLCTVRP